jgi:Bacterial antitoxin of type II TA system, VapB
MRTTITLDDEILESLRESTGIRETSALVRQALLEMRQREAGRRLAALKGSMPDFGKVPVPRRRPPNFTNS